MSSWIDFYLFQIGTKYVCTTCIEYEFSTNVLSNCQMFSAHVSEWNEWKKQSIPIQLTEI